LDNPNEDHLWNVIANGKRRSSAIIADADSESRLRVELGEYRQVSLRWQEESRKKMKNQ
jgi:hypothetical protein